jgi:hypothetical protein
MGHLIRHLVPELDQHKEHLLANKYQLKHKTQGSSTPTRLTDLPCRAC